MAVGSFASDLRLVLRTLAEVHTAEFFPLIQDRNTGRTEHGVQLHSFTDPEKVEAIVFASADSRDGKKDVAYSVQVRPDDEVVLIVGEIELCVWDEKTRYSNTDSVFKVSATATEAPQIADEIRRLAAEVCSQRHWLETLEVTSATSRRYPSSPGRRLSRSSPK